MFCEKGFTVRRKRHVSYGVRISLRHQDGARDVQFFHVRRSTGFCVFAYVVLHLYMFYVRAGTLMSGFRFVFPWISPRVKICHVLFWVMALLQRYGSFSCDQGVDFVALGNVWITPAILLSAVRVCTDGDESLNLDGVYIFLIYIRTYIHIHISIWWTFHYSCFFSQNVKLEAVGLNIRVSIRCAKRPWQTVSEVQHTPTG